MNKLLQLVFTFFSLSVSAQVLYQQDFTDGFDDMILIDVDKKTPNSQVINFKNAWTISDVDGDNWAVSNSWFEPVGKADDWMITPVITGITAKSFLVWTAFSYDSQYTDSYEVRISLGGDNTSDFNKVLKSIPSESPTANDKSISLAEYAGKDIRIAFRNTSNDKFLLHIDDIIVFNAKDTDISLSKQSTYKYNLAGTGTDVQCTFQNFGATTVNSMKVQYSDGEKTVVEDITNLNLKFFEKLDYTFKAPFVVELAKKYSIVVKVLEVNGKADEDVANDTGTTATYGLETAIPIKMVAEEGTGTWCGWCPRGAVNMALMKESFPNDFIGIAVHNNDPMTISEYDKGVGNFNGFSGYPGVIINRHEVLDPGDLQAYFSDDLSGRFSPTIVDMEAKLNADKTAFDVDAVVTLNTSYPNEKLNIVAVMIEDNVKGTGTSYNQANFYANNASGAMGGYETLPNPVPANKMVYQEVARKLEFGFEGRALSSSTSYNVGDEQIVAFEMQVPAGVKPEQASVVLMVTDEQGRVVGADKSEPVSIVDVKDVATDGLNFSFGPNPTNDFTFASINLSSPKNVTVELKNSLGQQVAYRNYGSMSGNQILPIEVSSFNSGIYYVNVIVGVESKIVKLFVE